MNGMERFIAERDKLEICIRVAGIDNIYYNKENIPSKFPCAIVILEQETGTKAINRQFLSTNLIWCIYLIVDAHKHVEDPDAFLYNLKDKYRDEYIKTFQKDFAEVEYYSSRLDGTRTVRIAKMKTQIESSNKGASA